MRRLLEQAIARLNSLPETEQDTYARMLLAEIEDEARWSKSSTVSQDRLGQLAEQARQDVK